MPRLASSTLLRASPSSSIAELPGRLAGRHRGRRRRRRQPPGLPARARSTSPAPTKARRSASPSSSPAVSGPYDLGNVVVRAAVNVDPIDAQVTAVSDPLPQILEGIPLRLRSVRSASTGPTSPSTRPTATRSRSARRSSATRGRSPTSASHYQVANCAILPFEPKLDLKLTGGLNRRGHPAIHATLTDPARRSQHQARSRSRCPKGELLDNVHIGTRLHQSRLRHRTPARPARCSATCQASRLRCSTSR